MGCGYGRVDRRADETRWPGIRRALFGCRTGDAFMSWSEDKTLRLWDGATTEPIGVPMKHDGPVYGALFAPDGRRILSWSYDGTLRLWDAATGASIGAPMKHDGPVYMARCSRRTGHYPVVVSKTELLRLWDGTWRQERRSARFDEARGLGVGCCCCVFAGRAATAHLVVVSGQYTACLGRRDGRSLR